MTPEAFSVNTDVPEVFPANSTQADPLQIQTLPAVAGVHPERLLAVAALPVYDAPVTSNFSPFVAEFVGVTVRPTALVVLVSRLIPACEVFPVPLVWNGIVQVDPSVQDCELTVVAGFASMALVTPPLAILNEPVVVIGPPVSPEPLPTLVTVPVLEVNGPTVEPAI